MNTISTNPCTNAERFLLNGDNPFIELLIKAEMEDEGNLDFLLGAIKEKVITLYEDCSKDSFEGDYSVLEASPPELKGSNSITWDIVSDGRYSPGPTKQTTLPDFIKHTEFRISASSDISFSETCFPVTAHGLLETLQHYNHLYRTMEVTEAF